MRDGRLGLDGGVLHGANFLPQTRENVYQRQKHGAPG